MGRTEEEPDLKEINMLKIEFILKLRCLYDSQAEMLTLGSGLNIKFRCCQYILNN